MRRARPLVLLLGLAAPALAAPAPTPLPIGGSAVDDKGQAIAGATAELYAPPAPLAAWRLEAAGETLPAPLASGKTDAQGSFALTAPDVGVYQVRISAAGRVPQMFTGAVVEALELAALEMPADAGLAVRVVDAAGKPVAGARVRLGENFSFSSRRWREGPWRVAPRLAVTGADGRVRFPREADEEVQVEVLAPGQAAVEATARGGQAAIDVKLAGGCPRVLEARDAAGKAAAQVWVEVDGWALAPTDEAGRLTVAARCREESAVTLADDSGRQAKTVLRPPAPGAASAGPVRLTLPAPAPPRTGRVLVEGSRQPLPGALVWRGDAPGAAARTDARGTYTLPRWPSAGEAWQSVSAAAAGHFEGWSRLAATGAAPTVVLKRAATLAGTVVEGGTRQPVQGAVLAANAAEADPWERSRAGRAKSDRQGAFRLRIQPGSPLELKVRAAGFAPAVVKIAAVAPQATRGGITVTLSRGRAAVGRVTDSAGAPVAGATVELRATSPTGRGRGRFPFGDDADGAARKAASGADGRFSFANLAGGRYEMSAKAPGFSATRVRGLTLPAAVGTTDLGTVMLQPGLGVAGRVVDRDDRPIAGATVRLWPGARGIGRFRGRAFPGMDAEHEAKSGADGTFLIADLAPGTSGAVAAEASGYAPGEPVRVTVPAEAPVRLVLQPAAKVSGRVVDDGGDPVPGAMLMVTQVAERAVGGMPAFPDISGTTDERGRFSLDGLEAGRIELGAQAEGYIAAPAKALDIAAGREVKDVELVVSRGAQVEGVVLGPDGGPVDGARVQVQRKEEGDRFSVGDALAPRATSDGDGRFRLSGLAPGVQSLSAEHEKYLRAVKDVDLHAGDTGHVEIRLGEGLAVSGRVVDAGGLPVAGARVALSAQGSYMGQQDWSGADGAFRFSGVTPGKIHLAADKEGQGSAKLDDLTVTDAPLAGIELRLAKGGAIVGRILGLSYPELSEVQVTGYGREGRGSFGRADVDFEGNYRIEDVGSGEWTVAARVPSNGRSASGKAQIPAAGAEVTLDLEFGGGFSLAGRVLYGGQPLAGASVGASAEGPGAAPAGGTSAVTDAAGAFRLESLKAGTYRLRVWQAERGIRYEDKQTVELSTSRDDVLIDIPGNARVRGRVIEAGTQAPVAGADIDFERQGDGSASFSRYLTDAGRSDAQGTWSVQAPPGTYRVKATKGGYAPGEATIDAPAGGEPPEVRITLSPAPGLTFTVTGVGGIPPSRVYAALVAGGGQTVVSGSYAPGEEGRTEISQAPAGSFTLLVGSSGTATVAVPVLVPSATTRVTLPLPTRLTVTVPALAEARDAKLTILGADGQPFRSMLWGGIPQAERPLYQGKAEIDDLPPGSYALTVKDKDGKTWHGTVVAAGGAVTQVLE